MGKEFLMVILFGAGILIIYAILKRFVLEKIMINKWVVLCIAFVLFLIPFFIEIIGKKEMKGNILWYIFSCISIVMFLWYIDLMGIGGRNVKRKSKKRIIMKSKPKPNRAKSLTEERKDNKIDKNR